MQERFYCPKCGEDLTEQLAAYLKRRNMLNAQKQITPEKRREMNKESQERLRQWRIDHPEAARERALAASKSRTAESFARQSQTVRDTARKKSIKFAELVFDAKERGEAITPELEAQLLVKARELVKAENKIERIARRKAEKKAPSTNAESAE